MVVDPTPNHTRVYAQNAEAGRDAATVGGGQEWSVSTFLLNAALLEEYVKQAKEREEEISRLRLEIQVILFFFLDVPVGAACSNA